MKAKDSDIIKKVFSDFYEKYPDHNAMLMVGVTQAESDFAVLKKMLKNYRGQDKPMFSEQINVINQFLNLALAQQRSKDIYSTINELNNHLLELIGQLKNSKLIGTELIQEFISLRGEFKSFRGEDNFRALPEDQKNNIENLILSNIGRAELFLSIHDINVDADIEELDESAILQVEEPEPKSQKRNVQKEDSAAIFSEIEELLKEPPEVRDEEANPNQLARSIENPSDQDNQSKSNRSSVVITSLSEKEKNKEEVAQAKMAILIRRQGNNFDLMLRDTQGRTILEPFVRKEKLKGLEYLLKKGADPNQITSDGGTVLHMAVAKGNLAMVEALLARNADPNIQNADGKTALHIAAELNRKDIAEALVAKNADRNIRDNSGNMAYELVGRNKRSSQQMSSPIDILENEPSKKVRQDSTAPPQFAAHRSSARLEPQKINFTVDVAKIEESINKFINPTSIQPEMRQMVAAYNSLKETLSGTNPQLIERVSQLQEKFETSRKTIIEALGYGDQFTAVEKLAKSDRLNSNTASTKELYTAVSKLSKCLESTLQSLVTEQKELDQIEYQRDVKLENLDSAKKNYGRFSKESEKIIKELGELNDKQGRRNRQRLNAAIDNIEVSLSKLDQLKNQLEQKLPVADRSQTNAKLDWVRKK